MDIIKTIGYKLSSNDFPQLKHLKHLKHLKNIKSVNGFVSKSLRNILNIVLTIRFVIFLLLMYCVIYIKYKGDINRFYCDVKDFFNRIFEAIKTFFKVGPKPSRKRCEKKHEKKCREILEEIYYPHKFPSIRPDFLKNPKTNRNLEIDCFNHELQLGLEYQGIQHRKYYPYYHKTIEDFEKQVERDNFKKDKLKSLGIKMIYIPDTVKYNDLEYHIKTILPNIE